jgi:hypothetical protein
MQVYPSEYEWKVLKANGYIEPQSSYNKTRTPRFSTKSYNLLGLHSSEPGYYTFQPSVQELRLRTQHQQQQQQSQQQKRGPPTDQNPNMRRIQNAYQNSPRYGRPYHGPSQPPPFFAYLDSPRTTYQTPFQFGQAYQGTPYHFHHGQGPQVPPPPSPPPPPPAQPSSSGPGHDQTEIRLSISDIERLRHVLAPSNPPQVATPGPAPRAPVEPRLSGATQTFYSGGQLPPVQSGSPRHPNLGRSGVHARNIQAIGTNLVLNSEHERLQGQDTTHQQNFSVRGAATGKRSREEEVVQAQASQQPSKRSRTIPNLERNRRDTSSTPDIYHPGPQRVYNRSRQSRMRLPYTREMPLAAPAPAVSQNQQDLSSNTQPLNMHRSGHDFSFEVRPNTQSRGWPFDMSPSGLAFLQDHPSSTQSNNQPNPDQTPANPLRAMTSDAAEDADRVGDRGKQHSEGT